MVKAKTTTYEEVRKQRMEENKKIMEQYNLTKLAQDVRNVSMKPSPMKKAKPRSSITEMIVMEARRSSRIASLPAPVYKDTGVGILERRKRYNVPKRDLSGRVYASPEARMDAIERAEELESKLENGFPTLVKPMLPSHVSGGFWLGLPKQFCVDHLSTRDDVITLVDDNGEEYDTVYLARKTGLSGGWKGFSVAHDLVDGDALVFEVVKPTEFKVHIIRSQYLTEA